MEKSSEYVFINPKTNNHYCQTTFTKLWDKIRKKAELKDFRFHDLRHTVGTRMAEKLVPVNVIKEVMAHTDIRTTQRYIQLVFNSKIKMDAGWTQIKNKKAQNLMISNLFILDFCV